MRQLRTTDGTWLKVNYSAVETSREKFFKRHRENPGCRALEPMHMNISHAADSIIHLKPDGSPTDIFLTETAKQMDRLAISCYWEVHAPVGMFIQMYVTKLDFKSPNEKNCAMTALLIADGPNFNDSYMRIGPNCYKQPIGLFGFRRTGVKNLTSTGDALTIHFYSYGTPTYIERHGLFRVELRATPCQGLLQACSHPVNWTTDHFNALSMPLYGGGADLNITFSCQKSKCCVLQQFPIYQYMGYKTCRIQLITHGNSVLATSKFQTNMVVPDKADAYIRYGCQRKENMINFARGPHRRRCRGTTSHLEYHSTSQWTIGAFSMSVAPSQCGYYRPDLHYLNEMYPPCADVEIPVNINTTAVTYVDYNYTENKYYSYVFNYRNESMCMGHGCGEAQIRIYGDNTYIGWSGLTPSMPLQWRTFGKTSDIDSFWRRNLTITRENNPLCDDEVSNLTRACELFVSFTDENMTRGPPVPDRLVSCPPGYEKVGSWCYMLMWPEDAELGVPLRHDYSITVEEAEAKCQKQGGHLLSVNEDEEHDAILMHIHYNWWPAYLQYIAGAKIFHIGLKKEVNDGK